MVEVMMTPDNSLDLIKTLTILLQDVADVFRHLELPPGTLKKTIRGGREIPPVLAQPQIKEDFAARRVRDEE
jgi:hypothetical protein